MPLSGALFSSVSCLDTTSTAISVIGDNIANVNTPGFKERRAEFSDVLGQTISNVAGFSPIGAGAKLSRISTIFTQGTFDSTGRATDLAIEGRGFFTLQGSQGTAYSRAGIFTVDNEGFLVNPDTMRVQGFAIDPLTGNSTGAITDIQIDASFSPPRTSTVLDASINLDARAPVIPGGFDPSDPSNTSNFQNVATLYDSLGNGHSTTVYFSKSGPNAWDWNATVPTADTTIPPATAGDDVVIQGSGTLTFDSQGDLVGATGSPVTYEFTGGGASGQVVTLGFGPIAGVGNGAPTTQYAEASATSSFTQDGFAAGTLQAVSIDRAGFITGTFSNGETQALAQLALASFPNIEGLQSIGGNNMIETRTSGQPLIGAPQSGSFGAIRSANLEQSTVDLAAQFVRLIINQRAFQANTRTISVTNELLANLVNLGQ